MSPPAWELPRTALLALWGTASLAGHVSLAQTLAAVQRDDEPHEVVADGLVGLEPTGLADVLAALAEADVSVLHAVLPVPGDPLGLPGPAPFNLAALEAGECLVAEPTGRAASGWGFVPEVVRFGSALEPGAFVVWRGQAVPPRRMLGVVGLAEADQELRGALGEATRELTRLDVAQWRDDAAGRIALIRGSGLAAGLVPASTPARCALVMASALRVRAIVGLAVEDDGASLTAHEAAGRREVLRDLDRVARHALVAATSAAVHEIAGD